MELYRAYFHFLVLVLCAVDTLVLDEGVDKTTLTIFVGTWMRHR